MSAQVFRANVGIVLIGKDKQLLMFERSDVPGAWQFPQGGLNEGEEPLAGAYRELSEETGLRKDDVRLAGEYPEWMAYELPVELRHKRRDVRGQVQRWFIFWLIAEESNINLESGGHAEFTRYKWVEPSEVSKIAVSFRQPIYQKLVRYIDEL